MSLSEIIAHELPYLRRFARALTGSQAAGDSGTAETLEAIIANPAQVDIGASPRASLYRVFLKIWHDNSAVDLSKGAEISPMTQAADRKLGAMTPRSRVAFLLHAMEGFTVDQIAVVLDCAQADVLSLLETARHEIALQIATDILIIEDEPIISMALEELVENQGHKVIAIARTHAEAVQAVEARRPGLVLADIRLADGSSGLNAVNEILRETSIPVIFITAFPEQLLTGATPEPTFLITKPFQKDMVQATIGQALFFERKSCLAAE